MTQPVEPGVTRRTALRMAVAAMGACGVLAVPARARGIAYPASGVSAPLDHVAVAASPRFRFECISPVPGQASLSRLEEVWSSPRYTTFTDCIVSYAGEPPFLLTAAERSVVDVVAAAGGDVSDPGYTYLLVLATSTRLHPPRLAERLARLGRPVVRGSVALAPAAPQAPLLRAWLGAKP